MINFIEKVTIAEKSKNHVLENYTLVKFESWGKGHIDAKTISEIKQFRLDEFILLYQGSELFVDFLHSQLL